MIKSISNACLIMERLGLAVLCLAVVSAAVGSYQYFDSGPETHLDGNRTEIFFEDHRFEVEIADSSEERARGLMNREFLGENSGMLFVYEEENDRSFWMKNTFIPLDIVFLDSNLAVINIEDADPEPNTSDDNLQRYRSERPAQYVLEINQNRSEEIGLEKGSEMSLRP
jgi:uncharacterized membrane protein (UPF0127 family)